MLKLCVREWREFRSLSQAELAELSGIENNTISRIEKRGNARPETVRRLAAALQIKPEELWSSPMDRGLQRERAVDPIDEMTEDELLSQFITLRFRGKMSEEDVSNAALDLAREVAKELRERNKK
jgi:transcriptional regulator with XRE-family HTH domain